MKPLRYDKHFCVFLLLLQPYGGHGDHDFKMQKKINTLLPHEDAKKVKRSADTIDGMREGCHFTDRVIP